jgi:hypothetical protein
MGKMQHKRRFLIDSLHLFVLATFALAQPLLGLLSKNAEFFVARHSKPVDILLLVVILCMIIPAIVVLIECTIGLFSAVLRRAVHAVVVAALVAAIFLPALKKIVFLPGTALLAGAAVVGATFTLTYIRSSSVRLFVTVLSPVLLIVPGLFIFNSPVSKLVFKSGYSGTGYTRIEAPAPVIIVVFDEFPLSSLVDEDHQIDPVRYPNFASLAHDAYWFRNATTVSDHTHIAVPAMLTGDYPVPGKLPTLTDHPENLFTLLGGSYDMEVSEATTRLCPDRFCRDEAISEGLTERVVSLLKDLSVVYLHILLSEDFSKGLPIITQSWKDFITGEAYPVDNIKDEATAFSKAIHKLVKTASRELEKDRAQVFRGFVRSIDARERPTLYFMHILLPHVPYIYLPSGRKYTLAGGGVKGLKAELWGDDESLVVESYQRHLLQVGFVDKLIGELVERLKATGIYEESLIIITADHGVSFRSGDSRRYLTKTNYSDIVRVPLFIKVPNQREGITSDRNVETIDILPTVAKILKFSLTQPVDGITALNNSLPEREGKIVYATQTAEKRFVFEPGLYSGSNPFERKLSLFGSGKEPYGLFRAGPHNGLVGSLVNEIDVEGASGLLIDIERTGLFDNIQPDAPFVPAFVTGRVKISDAKEGTLELAVSVNGIVSATTKTYPLEKGIHEWSAVVPESSFREGKNNIAVFQLVLDGGRLRMRSIRSSQALTYSLAGTKQGGETISTSDGKSIPVIPGAISGHVDHADIIGGNANFIGWAADTKNSELPDVILLFVNEKFFYAGWTNSERLDVTEALDDDALKRAGFSYKFSWKDLKDTENLEVRVFAVSRQGVATELIYPEGYKWGKKL